MKYMFCFLRVPFHSAFNHTCALDMIFLPNQNSIENRCFIALLLSLSIWRTQEISINRIKKTTEPSTIAMQTKTKGIVRIHQHLYIHNFRCLSKHYPSFLEKRTGPTVRENAHTKKWHRGKNPIQWTTTYQQGRKQLEDNSTQVLTIHKDLLEKCKRKKLLWSGIKWKLWKEHCSCVWMKRMTGETTANRSSIACYRNIVCFFALLFSFSLFDDAYPWPSLHYLACNLVWES